MPDGGGRHRCQTARLIPSSPRPVDHVNVANKIAAILDSARATAVPVVYLVDVSMRGRYNENLLAIAHSIEVLDGEVLIENRYQNGFIGTSLGSDLRAMGIATLLVTGFASHECVDSTVLGALAVGFDVVIVEEGHSGGENGRWARRVNVVWRGRGLQVVPSAAIDFTALGAPARCQDEG